MDLTVVEITLSEKVLALLASNRIDLLSELRRRVDGLSEFLGTVEDRKASSTRGTNGVTVLVATASASFVADEAALIVDAVAGSDRTFVTRSPGTSQLTQGSSKVSFLGVGIEVGSVPGG